MEQYVTKKKDPKKRSLRRRGFTYRLIWVLLSFLALVYTLPFLLIGGLCGLMLFARNRMDGAFAWRDRTTRKIVREEDEDDEDFQDGSGDKTKDNK